MDMALVKQIVGIVFLGMETWSDIRKKRFKKKYHKLLGEGDEAEDAHYPEYNDADVQISEKEMSNFLDAYREELAEHNVEVQGA